MAQLHYLFTDGCGGVAHCYACHAHIRLFFLHSDSAKCHNVGCGDPGVGPMTPKFEVGRYFCTMHLIAKFHHPKFNCSVVTMHVDEQTDKLTNKQTDAAADIHLAALCYAGG